MCMETIITLISRNISFIICISVAVLPTSVRPAGGPWGVQAVMSVLSIFYLAFELPDTIGLVGVMEPKLFL